MVPNIHSPRLQGKEGENKEMRKQFEFKMMSINMGTRAMKGERHHTYICTYIRAVNGHLYKT